MRFNCGKQEAENTVYHKEIRDFNLPSFEIKMRFSIFMTTERKLKFKDCIAHMITFEIICAKERGPSRYSQPMTVYVSALFH